MTGRRPRDQERQPHAIAIGSLRQDQFACRLLKPTAIGFIGAAGRPIGMTSADPFLAELLSLRARDPCSFCTEMVAGRPRRTSISRGPIVGFWAMTLRRASRRAQEDNRPMKPQIANPAGPFRERRVRGRLPCDRPRPCGRKPNLRRQSRSDPTRNIQHRTARTGTWKEAAAVVDGQEIGRRRTVRTQNRQHAAHRLATLQELRGDARSCVAPAAPPPSERPAWMNRSVES